MGFSVLQCSINVCKWFPVLFIYAVLGWSWYAYIIQLCFSAIDENSAKRWLYFILYHFILAIFLWAYFKTIFTPVKVPPKEFYLSYDDIYQLNLVANETEKKEILDRYANSLPLKTRTEMGGYRYCAKCNCIKPDRCHHCSMCDTCCLKMDHHCPWVNNCVGYSNYKFFYLFLFYALVYCFFIAATTLEFFIKFWSNLQQFEANRFHLLFLFFISVMFSISISTLFLYHAYLILYNRSTLESYRKPMFLNGYDKNGFNLGFKENLKQVFGDNIFMAFLPVFTSKTDGISFPSRHSSHNETEAIVTHSTDNISLNPTSNTIDHRVSPTYNTINIKVSSSVNRQSSFVSTGNVY